MQTSVDTYLAKGVPGQIADLTENAMLSMTNNSKQLVLVTVDTVTNTYAYTVTINGTTFTYTSDGSATSAEISLGLVTQINLSTTIPVTANDLVGTFTLQADVAQTAFTLTVDAKLSVAELISNAQVLPFGVFVCHDVDGDNKAMLPTVATDVTGIKARGIVLHSQNVEQALSPSTNVGYKPQSVMSVMTKGRVYVRVEENVTPSSAVYVRYAPNGVNTQLGAIRASADSSSAAAYASARFLTTALAGEVAVLEINQP